MNKIFILIFCSLYLSSCSDESSQQIKTNYFSTIISEEYSPNGKYKFTLGELNDSIYPSTQLIVDFGGCASSVYNPKGWDLRIEVHWNGNDTIIVACKKNIDKMKRPFAQCFRDKVYIQYISE